MFVGEEVKRARSFYVGIGEMPLYSFHVEIRTVPPAAMNDDNETTTINDVQVLVNDFNLEPKIIYASEWMEFSNVDKIERWFVMKILYGFRSIATEKRDIGICLSRQCYRFVADIEACRVKSSMCETVSHMPAATSNI